MSRVGVTGQSYMKKKSVFFKLIFIPAFPATETEADAELTTELATLTRRPNPTQWLDQWIDRWLNGHK